MAETRSRWSHARGRRHLAGTVTFEVFESSDCSGTAIYSQPVAVSGASPQTVSTTNTTVSTTRPTCPGA